MIGFLDASALIDLVDGEAPWAEATQATLQQLASEAADLALAVSRLSLLECLVAPRNCVPTMGCAHLMPCRRLVACNWALMP